MSLHSKPFHPPTVLKSAHPQLKEAQIQFFKVIIIRLTFSRREHQKDFDPLKNLPKKQQTAAKIPFILIRISKLNVSCNLKWHRNNIIFNYLLLVFLLILKVNWILFM